MHYSRRFFHHLPGMSQVLTVRPGVACLVFSTYQNVSATAVSCPLHPAPLCSVQAFDGQ